MILWRRWRRHRVVQGIVYLSTHYTWAFAAVMVITLASTLFSVHYLSNLEADLKDVYENDVRGGDSVQTAYTALLGIESSAKDLAVFPDKRSQSRARAEIKARSATLRSAMATAAPRFYTPRAKQALTNSKDDLKDFFAALDAVLAVHDAGKKVDSALIARLEDRSGVLQRDFDLLVANRIANSSIGIRDLVSQLRFSLIVTVVILVVTVLIRLVMYVAGHPRFQGRRASKTPPSDPV